LAARSATRESGDRRAISAVDDMHRRFPTLRVGALGVSLGGAAIALAGQRLRADAVVLESAYSTIETATQNRIAMRLGRTPARWLTPVLLLQLRPRIGIEPSALRPVGRIGTLRCPVLILSGDADRYTTADEAKALFSAAPSPKELWLVPNAVHEDLYRYDRAGYRRHVLSFLDHRLTTRKAALAAEYRP
jgi:fermentation-respiration switch protein FrsA (DUF1100 family)